MLRVRWLLLTALLSNLLSGTGAAGTTAYLIVGDVDALTVYNRYQQVASPEEKKPLRPFRPILVLDEDDRLGDGITSCMRVQAEGTIFYLATDSSGAVAHPKGFVSLYRSCVPLNDTVNVLTVRRIRITGVSSSQGRQLDAGQTLVRFFEYKGRAYCSPVGPSPGYGWIDFRKYAEGKDWKRVTEAGRVVPELPESTLRRIEDRVRGTNRALAGLYDFFNRRTSETRAAPVWQIAMSPDSVSIRLRGNASAGAFRQSTIYLAKDVENMVLGTGWLVVRAPGSVLVYRR